MYEEIAKYIEDGNYDKAIGEMSSVIDGGSYDDQLAILAATINERCGLVEESYQHIMKGLRCNSENYELYLMLGNYYINRNNNLACLCYEQALYYCEKQIGTNNEDYNYLYDIYNNIKRESEVRPLCVVIILKGEEKITKRCKRSIELTCYGDSYIIESAGNNEKINEIIKKYNKDRDILFVNNYCSVMANSIFCLRFGLYQNERVGTSGIVNNSECSSQIIDTKLNGMDEYTSFSLKNNIPYDNSYEISTSLEGTCLLVKGEIFEQISGVDVDYGMGTMIEYKDLCLHVLEQGYHNLLCWNSFVYCPDEVFLLDDTSENRQIHSDNISLFIRKWGFHPGYYTGIRKEIVSLISETEHTINVLEVGCGTGATLGRIKYKNPHAVVMGVELQSEVAAIGAKNFNIVCDNIETMELNYEDDYFDYIIFGDVLEHLRDPWEVIKRLRRHIKKGGKIITSIPNVMNAEVIYDLLHGNFSYQEAGILDRTHLRFFTRREIINLFVSTGYKIESMLSKISLMADTSIHSEFFRELLAIEGIADKSEFDTFQYLVVACKEEE